MDAIRKETVPLASFLLAVLLTLASAASGAPLRRKPAAATAGECMLTIDMRQAVCNAAGWPGVGKGTVNASGTSYEGNVNTPQRKVTESLETTINVHIETDPALGLPPAETRDGHGTVPATIARKVENRNGSATSPEPVRYGPDEVALSGDLDAAIKSAIENLRAVLTAQGKDTGPAVATNKDQILKSMKKQLDVTLTVMAEGTLPDGTPCRTVKTLVADVKLDAAGDAANVPFEEPKPKPGPKPNKPGK